MKTAGLVLDFYDDKTGGILKTACPTPDSLPGAVKTAHVLSSEERDLLRDDAFALILHNDGQTLRKFACVDEGNTVLSTLYFMETFDRLPVEAVKVAAARLSYFNEEFGLPVPPMLKLAAETGMARKRDSFKQPVVGDEADWAQRTNLVSVRGGSDAGRVIQSVNTMKTASVEKAAAGIIPGMAAGGIAAHALGHRWQKGAVLGGAAALGARAIGSSARSGQHAAEDERKITESIASNVAKKFKKHKKKHSSVEKTAIIGPTVELLGLGVPSAAGYVAGRNEGRAMAKGDIQPRNTLASDTAKFLLMPGATGYMIGKRSGYREAKGLTHKKKEKKKHSSAIAVDVSKLEPEAYVENKKVKLSALRGKYALDSYSDVSDAIRFFEESWINLDPADRHEFAVKTAARADVLGMAVPEIMERYGSTEYGPDVEAHLANRRAVAPQFKAVWDDLQEKRAMIEPEQFASLLREADELCNLNYEWGGAVADPFYATFGGRGHEKLAWAWQNADGDTLDEAGLRAIPSDKLAANFTPDFAQAFALDPVTIFESMPDTSKTIIARMAGG